MIEIHCPLCQEKVSDTLEFTEIWTKFHCSSCGRKFTIYHTEEEIKSIRGLSE